MLKKKKFDLITVGGSTVDISFYSKEGELVSTSNVSKQKLLAFEYGAKVVADRVFTTCGGGASNAAVSASRLGLKAAIFSRIGSDENARIVLSNFKANKVDSSFIKIDPKTATAFSMVLTIDNPSKEHIAFIHRGANSNFSSKDLALDKISTEWFYVTSLPKDSWEEVLSKLIATKKKIAWNPGNEQLRDVSKIKKLLPGIEILIMNRDESLEFRKLKDIKGLIAHLYSLGPKLVIITDGDRGAYAYDGKTYYFMKARASKVMNTLGVGDAFGSSLTSALIYGKNIKQALSWGIANSASVVSDIGAQKGLLTKKQLDKK